jgi:hypothetical protein
VIAVAATDSADHRASFSNRGPHVSISGPGVGVVSTYWDDTYASLSGTSMACPHVAGVAALVLSRNPALSSAQVGNILRSTAKPLRDAAGDPVPNDNYGSGLVQAAEAVRQAGPVIRTLTLICRKSFVVICQRSMVTVCNSVPLCIPTRVDCPSVHIICQRSVVTICVSRNLICPTTPVTCPDVRSLACPSRVCPSLPCGPGGPGEGFGAGDANDGWEGYDPYGYDPYGTEYE